MSLWRLFASLMRNSGGVFRGGEFRTSPTSLFCEKHNKFYDTFFGSKYCKVMKIMMNTMNFWKFSSNGDIQKSSKNLVKTQSNRRILQRNMIPLLLFPSNQSQISQTQTHIYQNFQENQ